MYVCKCMIVSVSLQGGGTGSHPASRMSRVMVHVQNHEGIDGPGCHRVHLVVFHGRRKHHIPELRDLENFGTTTKCYRSKPSQN